jgi:hypothetical protein
MLLQLPASSQQPQRPVVHESLLRLDMGMEMKMDGAAAVLPAGARGV